VYVRTAAETQDSDISAKKPHVLISIQIYGIFTQILIRIVFVRIAAETQDIDMSAKETHVIL